jgi:RNA polymerase sigma factor for flagellar operon FliA
MPQTVQLADLISAGLVGLVEAEAGFDAARKVPFESYASFRIRGAIIDSLRQADWAPRRLRSRGRAVQEAIRVLTSRLGRLPAEDEISGELKITLDAYHKLVSDLNGLQIIAIYQRPSDTGEDPEISYASSRLEDDPFFCCVKKEISERLRDAIEALPEGERLVTDLYYHEELTHEQIGLMLGGCERTIHPILTRAGRHLRVALRDLSPCSAQRFHLNESASPKRRLPFACRSQALVCR